WSATNDSQNHEIAGLRLSRRFACGARLTGGDIMFHGRWIERNPVTRKTEAAMNAIHARALPSAKADTTSVQFPRKSCLTLSAQTDNRCLFRVRLMFR
ncbi:MAG TPA: hypothetical protein VGD54_10985, partial [Steroidobacteraceae bacterium]